MSNFLIFFFFHYGYIYRLIANFQLKIEEEGGTVQNIFSSSNCKSNCTEMFSQSNQVKFQGTNRMIFTTQGALGKISTVGSLFSRKTVF